MNFTQMLNWQTAGEMSPSVTEVVATISNQVAESKNRNRLTAKCVIPRVNLTRAECLQVENIFRMSGNYNITVTPAWQKPGVVATLSWPAPKGVPVGPKSDSARIRQVAKDIHTVREILSRSDHATRVAIHNLVSASI